MIGVPSVVKPGKNITIMLKSKETAETLKIEKNLLHNLHYQT